MEKKFINVSANEDNPLWDKIIMRETPLYKRDNDLRTDFERDYTRVIYTNAYRRMKHKTQVFFSPTNDHICTRIEHVNNVESISYTIANALGLNTSLTKVIATAHDIGHSPFGHRGEKILSNISQKEKGVFTPFMVDSLWLCRLEPSLAAVGGTMLFGSVLLWAPQPGPLHLSAGQIPSGYSPPSHRPTAIPALPSLPSKQKLFVSFYPSFPWF